jgi:hypothetical protein
MTVAYQMPLTLGTATKVGPKLWRKAILRTGHISKNGIELDVDRALLETYAKNFRAGAKDQVQFLAGHNEDNLDAFRGDLVGLEVTDDQLVGMFSVTDKADRMLEENPRLGTSPSLVETFERADGRQYGPTLLHVAATFDPEVSQLGDWVRAELSATKTQVIDLSAPAQAPQASANPGGGTPEGDPVATLTDEQINKLLKLLEGDDGGSLAAAAKDKAEEGDGDEPEFTEAELKAMATPVVDEAPKPDAKPDAAKATEKELVNASHETTEALELANSRIDAQAVELARLRRERDDERYTAEVMSLAKDFAIPREVTELAKPLLYGTGHTLELSAGKQVDAGQIVRKVLKEMGTRLMAHLDLGREYGTADAQDDATNRQADLDEFIKRARAENLH